MGSIEQEGVNISDTDVKINGTCDKNHKLDNNHPANELITKAHSWDTDVYAKEFAGKMDCVTDMKCFRDQFYVPKMKDLPTTDADCVNEEDDCLYFAGNSLGLEPKGVKNKVNRELNKWSKWGVFGHRRGEMPWAHCDECVDEPMAKLVGAKRSEVGIMNGLTVNLHLQLISFYRPTPKRHKILLEAHSFPSDHYAIESQIRLHGYNPEESMICMEPREGEHHLRDEDILLMLETEGDAIAVVMFPGVQYFSGQLFDIEKITKAGQAKGCYVGWDLAHAVGNVELQLHDWGVDIACWCSYKYLNSGAGGIGGFFMHEKHFEESKKFPRLVGWWSHKMDTRFQMDNVLDLDDGARGFRISNPPPLLCAPLEASLEVFGQTSMVELRKRSKLLTAYMELLLKHYNPVLHNEPNGSRNSAHIITTSDPEKRGSQLSVRFNVPLMGLFNELHKRGVVCDKREPNVLRMAPVPLYNTFLDVFRLVKAIGEAIDATSQSDGSDHHLTPF